MTISLSRAKLMMIALAMTAAPAGAVFAAAPPAAGHFVIGNLLPPNGNGQGEPQAANSLPLGFMNGTPAMQRRDSIVAYRANQAALPN